MTESGLEQCHLQPKSSGSSHHQKREEAQRKFSLRAPEGTRPANTLSADLWPPGL